MVDIFFEDGTPVPNPNIKNKQSPPNLSFHVDKRMLRFLVGVKANLFKKDKDYVMLIDGYEGCLTGDTIIRCNRAVLGRKYNLKWMYNQYHNNPDKLKYFKQWDLKIPTYVRSFDGKRIRLHKINNVIYSGKKKVYLLKLKDGKSIKATANHKFLTKDGWKPLDKLNINKDFLMCDTPNASKLHKIRHKFHDIQIGNLYYHPSAKPFKEGKPRRISISQLCYESYLNNLELTEYLDIISNDKVKANKLKYVDVKIYLIHHKDGNHYNNSKENLQCLKHEEHYKLHGNYLFTNFNQGVPIYLGIESIKEIGIKDTYDIQCEEPYHNFVANDIIVHNSGKSTFAQQIGMYVDPTLCLDRVCMTADEFKNAIRIADKGQCVIYDEAVTGMSAGESITRIGRLLKSLMMQMRQKNLFVIVILPSVFELNKYAVLSRARSLFHMYEASGRMGYWVGYNKKDLRQLYLKGKKTYSYKVYSQFRGRFGGKYTVNEEDYRKKKGDALFKLDDPDAKDKMTNQQIKWYSQRDYFIKALREQGLTLQQIADKTKDMPHSLSRNQIQEICAVKLPKPDVIIG